MKTQRRSGALPSSLWMGLMLVSGACGRSCAATAAMNNETGTFYADPVPLNGGNVRGYVTLQNGVPTAVGMELSSGVLTNIPPLPLNAASATFGPLPPESAATPFAAIAVGDFPTGHQPAGIGDKPHFHPIFLLMPPQQPDPPSFALEATPVAPAEVPADHVNLGDVAPGIGIAYQDPAQPQNHCRAELLLLQWAHERHCAGGDERVYAAGGELSRHRPGRCHQTASDVPEVRVLPAALHGVL